MTRYHPTLVILHWLLAAMIIIGLIMGGFVLSETPNSDPGKIFALRMHMGMGILIGILMLVRLVYRIRKPRPPEADIGNDLLNKMAGWAHWALYLFVFLMVGSGIGISVLAGLPPIVFGGSGDPLPADFWDFPPRIAHGYIATALGLLIAGHVLASLYHHFVRKDGLLNRMWIKRGEG